MENLGVTLGQYQDFGNGAGNASMSEVDALMKAISAGSVTGRDTTGSLTQSGAPLKVESLESTLKVLTNTERDVPFWKAMPKMAATNTVEEYNQLVSYGLDGGAFTNEGELPVSADSVYRRQAALVKFMGTTREVTHPMQLVNTMVGNMIQQETKNGTMWILRQIEKAIPFANSNVVSQEWDGMLKQHIDSFGGYTASGLDSWQDSEVVVDLKGKILKDSYVEQAAEGINRNFGFSDKLIAPPVVFSNYVKQFNSLKLIQPNSPQVTAGVMGQKVVRITTQFGDIDLMDDKFWRQNPARRTTSAATSTLAPSAPTVSAIAVATDTTTRFGSAFAGDYFYAVAAKNRYGESTPTQASANLTTVAATEVVDLTVADGGGSYPATGYVVYRSTKTPTGAIATVDLYPIFEISVSQLAAGYDGGAATKIRDKNRFIPGTEKALMIEWDINIFSMKQLAPLMKMDLATLSPSTRFMVLFYGCVVMYAPKKSAWLINIGNDAT